MPCFYIALFTIFTILYLSMHINTYMLLTRRPLQCQSEQCTGTCLQPSSDSCRALVQMLLCVGAMFHQNYYHGTTISTNSFFTATSVPLSRFKVPSHVYL